jgi:general secretion pathway protein D
MGRSKKVITILVFVAVAASLCWISVGNPLSYLPGTEQRVRAESPSARVAAEKSDAGAPARRSDPNAPSGASTSSEPNQPGAMEPNQPNAVEPNQPAGGESASKGAEGEPNAVSSSKTARADEVGDPNDPLEAVNLKDVEMKNIIEKIAQWTGKTVIPHDDAMKLKITIYAPNKLPRSKALKKIYGALRMKGIVAEELDDTIYLKPLAEAKLGTWPTVQADQPLAMFENRDQIVRKFFKLTNYPAAQMAEIIRPLIGEYGHVSADETTSMLLVIDTVANLMSIERVIGQFDVPEAGKTVKQIFEIKYGDPAEIVQLLRMLLGASPDTGRGRGPYRGPPRPENRPSSGGPPGKNAAGAATSVVISSGDIPIVLIPEPKRKWIIASGSPEDIQRIHDWIEKLDLEEPVRSEYETVSLTYVNASEVANRIQEALQQMPGTELKPSVLVRPLDQARQIMIFGRADLREMIKKFISEIDMPPGTFEHKTFDLKHADPEQIKSNIDSLYGDNADSANRYSYFYYSRYQQRSPADTVKVIAFPTMKQVTVIASAENMRKIEKQIEEWDVQLDVASVKPRIITLQNSDPVQMAKLLTTLFSEDQSDSSRSFIRWYFFDEFGDQKKKIVGPLYGQLTFEEVPGTKKIIVISKIPEAYDVIEQLILELDRQEMAETPKVVQLKYADPEDLAERLNAIFNEPGTVAPIRRTARGLGNYSMDQSGSGQSNASSSRNDNNSNNSNSNPGEYTPPWSRGARRTMDEEPISNVIGRVRFIPDPHSKSLLVLAPPEFMPDLEETIRGLDVPGMQVMIKATVVEVDHGAMTSLGVQLATNPEAFGNLGENAVTALSDLTALSTGGTVVPANTPLGVAGSGSVAGITTNVFILLDFLMKHTNAKILNEQTLWTEDNEEASFFKGQKVAFVGGTSTTGTGIQQSSFQFEKVGMTLAVRPSITPEKNVDMIVNIILSQLTGELVNGQPVRTEMETETNMIVSNSETLMLGGILFQENTRIKRKVPLLGDLPLLGGLFQHNRINLANNELIIFITPQVISETIEMSEGAKKQIEESKRRLGKVRSELNAAAEQLREELHEEQPQESPTE